jgi:type I thyroxine 5'-deiodinase
LASRIDVQDGVLFGSPATENEREDTAKISMTKLGVKIPSLVDGIENQTERAYSGWPDRLYVVGKDLRVQYKSAPGPFGFSTKELENALKQTIASS